MENVGVVGTNEYLCWLSQAMKADLSFLFPSACYVIDVEEPQDMNGIAMLMRKCWWINGQGEKDINSEEEWAEKIKDKVIWWGDVARTCYLFTPKEDTLITDFEEYLKTHDRTGKEVKEDSESTTWNYIQKKPTEKTGICFDEKFEEDTKLQKGRLYYIIFYDDKSPISEGERDRILISRDPEFGKEQTEFTAWLEEMLKEVVSFGAWKTKYCYSPEGKKEREEEKEKATEFFNNLINTLEDCSKLSVNEQCSCTQDFHPVTLGDYKIKFEKTDTASELTLIDKNDKTVERLSKQIPRVLKKENSYSGLISSEDEKITQQTSSYYELTLQPDKTFVLKKRISELGYKPFLSNCKTIAEKLSCENYKKEKDCFAHSDKCYPSLKRDGSFLCQHCGEDFKCSKVDEKWCDIKTWCSINCELQIEEQLIDNVYTSFKKCVQSK